MKTFISKVWWMLINGQKPPECLKHDWAQNILYPPVLGVDGVQNKDREQERVCVRWREREGKERERERERGSGKEAKWTKGCCPELHFAAYKKMYSNTSFWENVGADVFENISTGGPRYLRGLRSTKIPRISKPRILSPIIT